MVFDYEQVAQGILGVIFVSVFGYYAIKLVLSFRTGLLERGWKQVAFGAVFLVLAQFIFLPMGMSSSGLSQFLNDAGTLMRFIGMLLLIIGFRTHYLVWRVDNKKEVAMSPRDVST